MNNDDIKVGDFVRVLGNNGYTDDIKGHVLRVVRGGEIGVTVERVDGRGWRAAEYGDGLYYFLTMGNYEKATNLGWKVGDVVDLEHFGRGTIKGLNVDIDGDFASGFHIVELVEHYYDHDGAGLCKPGHGFVWNPYWINGTLIRRMDQTGSKVETVEAPKEIEKSRVFDMSSQSGRILAHLLEGNTVTPLQAIGVFGAYRLAARIKELRNAGHKIKTTMKRDPVGRPYAEYSLRSYGRV